MEGRAPFAAALTILWYTRSHLEQADRPPKAHLSRVAGAKGLDGGSAVNKKEEEGCQPCRRRPHHSGVKPIFVN